MAKKELTVAQRHIVATLHLEGNSQRKIVAKTGFAKSTVHSLLKKYYETGTVVNRPGRGRKRKTTPLKDRILTREMRKDRKLSAYSLADSSAELIAIPISDSTIRRRMRELGFNGRIARKKSLLKPAHIKRRMAFASEHIEKPIEFWNKVIWSDESKFNLFGSDGRIFVWRKPKE